MKQTEVQYREYNILYEEKMDEFDQIDVAKSNNTTRSQTVDERTGRKRDSGVRCDRIM